MSKLFFFVWVLPANGDVNTIHVLAYLPLIAVVFTGTYCGKRILATLSEASFRFGMVQILSVIGVLYIAKGAIGVLWS